MCACKINFYFLVRDIMKSIFFPGGRNYRLLLIFSLVAMISVQASAMIITEDFENVTTASTMFTTDGVINHSIVQYPGFPLEWDVSTDSLVPPTYTLDSNALDLWPAQDLISFTLAEGQFIDYASLDYMDWGGQTYARITGEFGFVETLLPIFGIWRTLESTPEIGNIQSICLASSEGAFDNITVNVVPEPMTLSFLGFGVAMLRKRKRR